jgi:hypothetical protein
MKQIMLCLLVTTGILFSCTPQKDVLVKAWIFNDAPNQNTGDNAGIEPGFATDSHFNTGNFIDLQADGTYSCYFPVYETGKWFFKDQMLILVNRKKDMLELQVKKVDDEELVCTNKLKRTIYRFKGLPNNFLSQAENPFSVSNNLWRIKPLKRETDEQLRKRMKNHFTYWKQYFSMGLKNKMEVLDIGSTPSLFKMYGNGIQLEYYDNLFPEWKSCFYDSIDCRLAYENVYYKMYQHKIKWPDTKNRFESFVSAFTQLEQWMDEKTSPYVGTAGKQKKD